MSVSLTDQSRRVIVGFRRSGGEVFVDTWVDGVVREFPVSAADLQQLATFLSDLATTRWSETPASASAVDRLDVQSPLGSNGTTDPRAPRAATLPPYPQAARWVPAPSGGIPAGETHHSR